jgi:hypothetical protein
MSEYQYYEFLAVDRTLDERQLAELRALSTRARIGPNSFVDTYEWGDFRGDPARLMETYFDAFLYFANWNTRRLMIRLPASLLSIETVTRYCAAEPASAWLAGEYVVLDLVYESDEGSCYYDGEGWLATIIPVRADLAAGDLRTLYIGWLLCAQAEELAEDDMEPPLPANLGSLTASLSALCDFLCIDEDLLAVAATGAKEPRTVGQLLQAAEARRAERERLAAARAADERARLEQEAAIAYEKRLAALALREGDAWRQVNLLIEARKPAEYDEAALLLDDLKALAGRNGRSGAFDQRISLLREQHSRKVSLMRRLDRLRI